jgi:hypothetical protein
MAETPVTDVFGSPRCVLWHAGDITLPGELLASLTKRIGRVTVCTDAHAALAEACLIHRASRPSSATTGTSSTPPTTDRPGVLLLLQPKALENPADVLDAAEVYAPSVLRWVYDRSATPKLRPVVPSDLDQLRARNTTTARPSATFPASAPVAVHAPAHVAALGAAAASASPSIPASSSAGPPALRLVPAPHDSVRDTGAPSAEPSARPGVRPRPLLSEEELRMLLGTDPVPSTRGQDGGGVS